VIEKDFEIDFQNRKIIYKPGTGGKVYTINEFYSFLQEVFSQPQNMDDDIPIEAGSKRKYSLVNGWTMDKEAMGHLKGGSLIFGVEPIF